MELYKNCTINLKSAFEEDHGNVLVGDGTLDSRRQGEYCTYTLIAKVSKKVLSTVTIPRALTGSSAKLEEIGLNNTLMELPETVLDKIKIICTDKSVSIVKKIKDINNGRIQTGKPTIEHAHCVWHRDKNICSKLSSFFFIGGWSSSENMDKFHSKTLVLEL